MLAVLVLHLGHRHGWRSGRTWAAGAAWLLFFPNAPYLFTDLTHLKPTGDHRFWVDMVIILLFAWPAFLVGCLSLRLLHSEVAGRFGGLAGWGFALGACGLAGVGVYIGRFLRWNSWDILVQPVGLAFDLFGFLGHPLTHPSYRLCLLFGVLLFVGYTTLHAASGETLRRSGNHPGSPG
jgi:uncharacterized membrane protein